MYRENIFLALENISVSILLSTSSKYPPPFLKSRQNIHANKDPECCKKVRISALKKISALYFVARLFFNEIKGLPIKKTQEYVHHLPGGNAISSKFTVITCSSFR